MRLSRLAARLPVREGERGTVAVSALSIFALMSGYYVLRPVRDELGVRAGVDRIPWLFTATSVAILLLVPVFGWAASRIPRRRLVPAVNAAFAATLAGLAATLSHRAAAVWARPVLFVFVSMVAVFAVSASWSLFSDVFSREQAGRLFGIVAAGGSAGALAGPAAMSFLGSRVEAPGLVAISAGLFAACAALSRRLARSAPFAAPEPASRPIGGNALSGVGRTARSPFLLALCLALICYTFVSTLLYFSQTRIVGAAIADAGRRTVLFARIDLAVNALAMALQLLVTAPLVRRIGVGGALAASAALVTGALAILGVAPTLGAVVLAQVLHRALHFAVGRPAREALFVPLDAEARYKAKSFIDTAVFRLADTGSAWALTAFRAAGADLERAIWLSVPVGIVWTATCWRIGRIREPRRGEEPAAGAEGLEAPCANRRLA
jgi:AAA family ATP:ADP antiporter